MPVSSLGGFLQSSAHGAAVGKNRNIMDLRLRTTYDLRLIDGTPYTTLTIQISNSRLISPPKIKFL